MKRMIGIVLTVLVSVSLCAQSTKKIRELEKQHAALQKQISDSESLLQSTKQDVKSQLDNLAVLSGQITDRKQYIETIEKDVQVIQKEISRLKTELNTLERELAEKKKKYEKSVMYMYKNKSVQEKLMFIFSADNLSQMYRRMRYVREYADYQRRQGKEVQRKQYQVSEKQKSLLASRNAKENILKQGEAEKLKLEAQEKERKALLSALQKKQWEIQHEIKEKRRSANRLNAEIDRLIEMEIEAARKRKEAEARRKAEAKRKQKEAQKETLAENKKAEAPESKVEVYKTDNEDRRLSDVFEKNKGKLPMPITGAYAIVGHYGKYQVKGLRNVRLDNKGIDIKGKEGAQARVIFDGEVSAIFQYNGLANVLVRHGSYISVYCNLSSVLVKKGSVLKTKDVIGQVHTDATGNTVLHFQLRKETAKLNPELWLIR
ncbi:peptidoglycan DD-metalloendopeptidase family protein [Phocaeicola salanitronis]|uniref:murein hydrolase activator EnvC family protein n=1 Tax=Phocaeicola salanitronis TaxID=376805 RepID=UPI0023F825DF|nr:peptidoglycan DD-metalloendopeptidase family protein [Phocaeicola salanitronis]